MIARAAGAARWKHQTAEKSPTTEPIGVDFFDDEETGFVTVYLRFPDGSLWPARTVNARLKKHAKSVLDSWANNPRWGAGGLIDHRKVPL